MLALDGQLRVKAVENPLHSLFLHVHHEQSEAAQGIEPVNESGRGVSSLTEGDKLLREFVPLRQRNELSVEASKKMLPLKDGEVQPCSDSLPQMKGSSIQVLGH